MHFCEFTALFHFAASDWGSTVPRKIDLNWFMPALVKRRVGSDRGTTEEEGTVLKLSVRLWPARASFHAPTKRVTIFLEVVQERVSDAHSVPLVLLGSHLSGAAEENAPDGVAILEVVWEK